jgi:hypothetical protein
MHTPHEDEKYLDKFFGRNLLVKSINHDTLNIILIRMNTFKLHGILIVPNLFK